MQTLQGMLAQTIHEDRVRGYDDRTLGHRAAVKQRSEADGSDHSGHIVARFVARFRRAKVAAPAVARP